MREGAESQHIYPPTSGRIQFPLKERVTILKQKSNDPLVTVMRFKNIGKYREGGSIRHIHSTL